MKAIALAALALPMIAFIKISFFGILCLSFEDLSILTESLCFVVKGWLTL